MRLNEHKRVQARVKHDLRRLYPRGRRFSISKVVTPVYQRPSILSWTVSAQTSKGEPEFERFRRHAEDMIDEFGMTSRNQHSKRPNFSKLIGDRQKIGHELIHKTGPEMINQPHAPLRFFMNFSSILLAFAAFGFILWLDID